MKRFALVLAIVAFVLPAVCFAGPFGFDYGMTKEQAIAAVGHDKVYKDEGYILRVVSAPKPDDRFEHYTLIFSPERGLLKIVAAGSTIDTNEGGTELRVGFGAMRESLAKTYGAPTKSYDFLQPDSDLDSPTAFTESLRRKQRVLAANWDITPAVHKQAGPLADHLNGLVLETLALTRKTGWLQLTYEFEGFQEFYEAMQKQADAEKAKALAPPAQQPPAQQTPAQQ
jgi:hypothetical protein